MEQHPPESHSPEQRPRILSTDNQALAHNLQTLHDSLLSLLDGSASPQALGTLTLQALEKMGLSGAIYLHATGEVFSTLGPLTDLETLLLQQATHSCPSEYAARYLWGSEYLGAIVQNMPLTSNGQYQPLLLILGTLFSAINKRLGSTVALSSPRPHPQDAVDLPLVKNHSLRLEHALETLEQQSETQLGDTCQTLKQLQTQLSDPQQRQTVKSLIDNCMQLRLSVYDQCLEIQSQHSHMREQLRIAEPET